MESRWRRNVACAVIVLLLSIGTEAQAGGVFGQLNGPRDVGPLPGADVKLCPTAGGGKCRSAVTASDGSFQFRAVPAGTYKVTSSSSSGAVVSSNIVVPSDGNLNLSITAP